MRKLYGCIGLCLGGLCASAHAEVLGSFDFSEQYALPVGIGVIPSTSITLQLAYSVGPGGLTDMTTLVFDGFEFVDGDDGRLVSLGSVADDAEFAAFVARATNGVDDDLRDDAIGNNGGGLGLIDLESQRIDAPLFVAVPDLAGASISALELFIGAIDINPAAGTGEVNWTVSGQLRFIGTIPTPVPLPAGLPLLAAALPWLRANRNGRHSRRPR